MKSREAPEIGVSLPKGESLFRLDARPSVSWGVFAYLLSGVPVFLGVCLGYFKVPPGAPVPYGEHSLLLRFAAWDGGQFMSIVEHGYSFAPDRISNVAMFPGYPAIASIIYQATGLSSVSALLVVSHVSLIGVFIAWHWYLTLRFAGRPELATVGLLVMALWPTTFFLRMAYSESLFLLLAVLVLIGLRCRWSWGIVALLIGAAVSVRFAGVALIPPYVVSICAGTATRRVKLRQLVFWVPFCLWGVVVFMVYLKWQLGAPYVFSQAQASYCLRPPVSVVDHWYRLVTLEPVWGNYVSGNSAYWRLHDSQLPPIISLQFANPIWFCFTVVGVLWGWAMGRVTDCECSFAMSLLAVSYVARAEEFCMGSQARYAAAALPVYIVVAQCLLRLPVVVRCIVAASATLLLIVYSALFAAWYFFP